MNNATLQLTLQFQSVWWPPGSGKSGLLALIDGHAPGDHSFSGIRLFVNIQELMVVRILMIGLVLSHVGSGLVSCGCAYNCSLFPNVLLWIHLKPYSLEGLSTLAL